MTVTEKNRYSRLYQGMVSHRRFTPSAHSFQYSLFMLCLDAEEMESRIKPFGLFGFAWYAPLRFLEKDYLPGEPGRLLARIKNKVVALGGSAEIDRVLMLVQVRCFNFYFSPANFYFCYDKLGNCQQMLAEVSNTPWNERHYYLVNLTKPEPTQKVFHVSPFMDMNMSYHWQITPPTLQAHDASGIKPQQRNSTGRRLLIHIDNKRSAEHGDSSKVFDATLAMSERPFTCGGIAKVWGQLPFMTVKIVMSIYWQALKLWLKKIPFVGHPKRS